MECKSHFVLSIYSQRAINPQENISKALRRSQFVCTPERHATSGSAHTASEKKENVNIPMPEHQVPTHDLGVKRYIAEKRTPYVNAICG